MNKLIRQIIEIEDMAQEVVSEAKNKENSLSSVINADIEQKKDEIISETEYEKKRRISASDKITAQKLAEVKKMGEEKIKMLDMKYTQSKEQWKNELFERIIND